MENEKITMALTPEMVAEESHKAPATIYRLIKQNKLPHVKLGRSYLISRVEFEKWLSGQYNNTPPAGPTGTAAAN